MTYDDWKATDTTPEPDPNRCETCGHPEGYCDCPCCHEDVEEHAWEPNFYGACVECGRPRSKHP
jgi:ribosomal protein S14